MPLVLKKIIHDSHLAVAEVPDGADSLVFCPPLSVWFFVDCRDDLVGSVDIKGDVSVWLNNRVDSRIVSIACSNTSLFTLHADGVIFGHRLDSMKMFRIVGENGRAETSAETYEQLTTRNILSHDVATDSLVLACQNRNLVLNVGGGGRARRIIGCGKRGFCVSNVPSYCWLDSPVSVAAAGGAVYVSDFNNHVVWEVDLTGKRPLGLIGKPNVPGWLDGAPTTCLLESPGAIACKKGLVAVVDGDRRRIRRFDSVKRETSTVVGMQGEVKTLCFDDACRLTWLERPE